MEDDAAVAERLQQEELAAANAAPAADGMMEEPNYAQEAIDRQRALNAQRGLGQQFNFANRQGDTVGVETYAALTTWVIDIIILLIIVLICELSRSGKGCGIPVIFWVEIFFVIWLLKSTFGLNIIWILRTHYEYRIHFYIFTWILFTAILVGWIIYGYTLYFSDENDCQTHDDTSGWLILMIILLFLGLFVMLAFTCAIICGPIFYMWFNRMMEEQARGPNGLNDSQIPQVISKLTRVQYDPETFKYESACKICLMDYEPEDELTQLKCDPRHYFHSECIIRWIQDGHNICPFCREPIENVDDLRQMMEGGEFEYIIRRSGVDRRSQTTSQRRRQQQQL